MKKLKSHMPTEEELLELNPNGVDIDMDLVKEELHMKDKELIQDTFNEDDVMATYNEDGSFSLEGVENAEL